LNSKVTVHSVKHCPSNSLVAFSIQNWSFLHILETKKAGERGDKFSKTNGHGGYCLMDRKWSWYGQRWKDRNGKRRWRRWRRTRKENWCFLTSYSSL